MSECSSIASCLRVCVCVCVCVLYMNRVLLSGTGAFSPQKKRKEAVLQSLNCNYVK
jgi:hypothetical protein